MSYAGGHERAAVGCQWCGREVPQSLRGRPRKFCSASCKQRAYEQRNNVQGTQIPADAVILSRARVEELRDGLFELRCCAEDLANAAADGEEPAEIAKLAAELINVARHLESIK